LDDLFGGFKSGLLEDVSANTKKLLTKYDEKIQTRLGNIEGTVQGLAEGQEKIIAAQNILKEEVQALTKAFGLVESNTSVQDALDMDDYVQAPQRHKIRMGTAEPVAKAQMLKTATEWLSSAGFTAGEWTLVGPNLGNSFSILFGGEATAAGRKARNANRSLQMEDGIWREITVETPASKPEAEKTTKIFISPDQSPQADDQYKLARKTIQALKEVCPDRVFRYVRRTAMVKTGSLDIACPVCDSRETQGVKWHLPNLAECGIDKSLVLAKLDILRTTPSASSASGSQWSF